MKEYGCFAMMSVGKNVSTGTGARTQCKGSSSGAAAYLYGSAPFASGTPGPYPSGSGYGSYPQSYQQEYQYSTSFQSSAASTSAYYGHTGGPSSYYYNPSPSTSSATPSSYPVNSNPTSIPGLSSLCIHQIDY